MDGQQADHAAIRVHTKNRTSALAYIVAWLLRYFRLIIKEETDQAQKESHLSSGIRRGMAAPLLAACIDQGCSVLQQLLDLSAWQLDGVAGLTMQVNLWMLGRAGNHQCQIQGELLDLSARQLDGVAGLAVKVNLLMLDESAFISIL